MSKEIWYHIEPSDDSHYQYEAGWCPASTVQVFLDDGWKITESVSETYE
jgi:hypothetical protein